MAVKHVIFNKHGKLVEVNLTPIKSIRAFCKECMCYVDTEIPKCTSENCPLYPFRMGKSFSGRKGNASELALYRAKSGQGSTI